MPKFSWSISKRVPTGRSKGANTPERFCSPAPIANTLPSASIASPPRSCTPPLSNHSLSPDPITTAPHNADAPHDHANTLITTPPCGLLVFTKPSPDRIGLCENVVIFFPMTNISIGGLAGAKMAHFCSIPTKQGGRL